MPLKEQTPLGELNLLDDFLFNEVISRGEKSAEVCRIMLQTILGREIPKVRVVAQRSLQGRNRESHGIRMDAYIEEVPEGIEASVEVGTIYDIEPNKERRKNDPETKRLRYYHSLIDSKMLEAGAHYNKLKNVIIIMITSYDPFELGDMFYEVRRQIMGKPEYNYEDGSMTIFLYTKGRAENPSKKLQDMLKYMENSMESNAVNDDLQTMHQLIEEVKRDQEVGVRYMQSWEREAWLVEDAREQGLREGREEGLKAGGIRSLIKTCKEFEVPKEEILTRIEKEFQIEREEAEQYWNEYKEE